MKVLLIDNGTRLLDKLQKLIDAEIDTRTFGQISTATAQGYDLIILSGSSEHSVVRDHGAFQSELDLIRSSETPIIGICFGCELIANAFGGKLKELAEPHEGIREITIKDTALINRPVIRAYEHHRWIISEVPKDFRVIAESEDGPEGIEHETRRICGLQFHPENFVDTTEGDDVFFSVIKAFTQAG